MQHYYLKFNSSTNNTGSKSIQMSRSHMQKSLLWDWRLETEGNQIEKKWKPERSFFQQMASDIQFAIIKGRLSLAIISGSSLDYDICARGVVEVGPRRAHPNSETTGSAQKAHQGFNREKSKLLGGHWFALPGVIFYLAGTPNSQNMTACYLLDMYHFSVFT